MFLMEKQKLKTTNEPLRKGDSVFFEEAFNISTNNEAVVVYFELDMKASFSRNGLYAQ